MVLVWQIADNLPNSSNFLPTKRSCYTVLYDELLVLLLSLVTQIVVVFLSDFTVLCYNHKLDLLLWSIKLTHNKDISNMVIR